MKGSSDIQAVADKRFEANLVSEEFEFDQLQKLCHAFASPKALCTRKIDECLTSHYVPQSSALFLPSFNSIHLEKYSVARFLCSHRILPVRLASRSCLMCRSPSSRTFCRSQDCFNFRTRWKLFLKIFSNFATNALPSGSPSGAFHISRQA